MGGFEGRVRRDYNNADLKNFYCLYYHCLSKKFSLDFLLRGEKNPPVTRNSI